MSGGDGLERGIPSRFGTNDDWTPTLMRSRRNLAMAVMAVGVFVIIGFVVNARTNDEALSEPTGERSPDGLTAFYNQKLTWDECGTDQCTWVRVPVDYQKPKGETLRLRVKYRQAESREASRKLFINLSLIHISEPTRPY